MLTASRYKHHILNWTVLASNAPGFVISTTKNDKLLYIILIWSPINPTKKEILHKLYIFKVVIYLIAI